MPPPLSAPSVSASDLAPRVDRIESQLDSVVTAVGELAAESRVTNASVNQIADALRQQAAVTRELQRPRETNWGWLIAALGSLGGFIMLYTRPIETAGNLTQGRVAVLEDERVRMAEWRGEVKARLGILEARP